MAKEKVSSEDKLETQEFDLFGALAAIDKKDYGYYDKLTAEQQKKFIPFMMLHWVSTVKGSGDLQSYYLQSTNLNANMHMFNENVIKHPKLQWLMLCAASPGVGKQFHQWIPHIKESIKKLREPAKQKEIKDYFAKVYPKVSDSDLTELSAAFVEAHTKKIYLAEKFPTLKYDEIELLSDLITAEDIKEYETDSGN